jgi:threonine/homoserine/homoserine lactone efflux protein
VALGASTVLNSAPQLIWPVTIAASLYMLYLAWRIATAPPLSDAAAERRAPGWLAGLILAIANPKAYLAIGAVYTTSVLIAADAHADALLKFFILSAAIVVIHALWSLAGSFLTSALRNPRASRAINLALAATLVLVVLADLI